MPYAATANYASGTGPPLPLFALALGAAALRCFGEPSYLVVRQVASRANGVAAYILNKNTKRARSKVAGSVVSIQVLV